MTILGNVNDISEFKFEQYVPGNPYHDTLLDEYMSTTPILNNSTRKKLKTHLYDGINGALFLVIHNCTNTIDAMSSCVKYDENNLLSAKVWHRLHIKDNVPNTVIDAYFEYATSNWCITNNIFRQWVTFNEDSPRTAFWAASRMGERRNAHRPNTFTNGFMNDVRSGWRPHSKLIYEMETWQYVIFYSPDSKFFLSRPERPLNIEAKYTFKREYPNATHDWL